MQRGPVSSILSRFIVSRNLILIIVTFVVGLMLFGVITFRIENFEQLEKSGEDFRCYYGIVEKIHSGEGYYNAAHKELQDRGYPTHSVFNWRLPLLAMFIGRLPNPETAKFFAIFLSLFSLWLWIDISIKKLSILRIAAGTIPLSGLAVYSLVGTAFLMHELWAGILISISLFAYGKGWRALSLASGILSLFIRELALPFVAIMFFSSLLERKRGEAAVWFSGLTAFFIALSLHAMLVKEVTNSGGNLDFGQWFAFSGWTFVLATIHTQPFLIVSPSWCTAALAPLALIGFLGWRDPVGLRTGQTITIYVLIFLFIGQSINAYWGLLYCNLIPLGLLYTHDVMTRAFADYHSRKGSSFFTGFFTR
jgi:hypothetical protein